MSGEERSLRDIWATLSLITRRLDELAGSIAKLHAEVPLPTPLGEPLDEPTRRELRTLRRVLAIDPDLGREEAFRLAVDRVIHDAGAESAALLLATRDGTLEPVAYRGFSLEAVRLRVEGGIVDRAFRERDTIRAGPEHQAADPLLRDHGLLHAIATPVCPTDRAAAGVLLAGRRRAAPFGPDAVGVLALVADRVARIVDDRPPGGVGPAVCAFAADLDLARVAERVGREAAIRLGATRVAVLLPGEHGLTLAGGVGVATGAALPDPNAGALASALQAGRPVVVSEAPCDEALGRLLEASPRLVVPLTLGGVTVAVLVAGGPRPLEPRQIEDLLPAAAGAIRNARVHGEAVAALTELSLVGRRSWPPPPRPVRDFANLLAVILARVSVVREQVSDSTVAADLQVVEEAAWRAAEGMRDALGLAARHRDETLAPLDLGAVIRSAVETAEGRWSACGRARPTVEVDLSELPPIRGRADQLGEALDHLLENAAEAAPPGGAITVRARWHPERGVEVTVRDLGAGMDEEVRARASEPFFSTRGLGRLGLGLTVAQAIVSQHRGSLTLLSEPGQGTTVRLVFPTARAWADSEPALRG